MKPIMKLLPHGHVHKENFNHSHIISPLQYQSHPVIHHVLPQVKSLSYISQTITSDSLEFEKEIQLELTNPYQCNDAELSVIEDLADFTFKEIDD